MLYVVRRACAICCEACVCYMLRGVRVLYVVRRACAICCEECVCYML